MIRRSVKFLPGLLFIGAVAGGWKGIASTAFAITIVLANFALSVPSCCPGRRASPSAALGVAAIFGFLLRLGLITVAVLAVHEPGWVKLVIARHLARRHASRSARVGAPLRVHSLCAPGVKANRQPRHARLSPASSRSDPPWPSSPRSSSRPISHLLEWKYGSVATGRSPSTRSRFINVMAVVCTRRCSSSPAARSSSCRRASATRSRRRSTSSTRASSTR